MTKPRKPILAIAYDFDGTLAPGNMQEHNFIPDLNTTRETFWDEVKRTAQNEDGDEILAYMHLMLEHAHREKIPVRRRDFVTRGRALPFFPGVEGWFDAINSVGRTHGVKIEHYIISSGLREMISGTRIYRHITRVFASGFAYDQHGVATWPALAINYTTKTQYLFRINKGIDNSYDNTLINAYMQESNRRVPFRRIIYIGDGDTDVPAMKMVKHLGGYSIAVYKPGTRGTKKRAMRLLAQERADFVIPADYREESSLFETVETVVTKVAAEHRLSRMGKT